MRQAILRWSTATVVGALLVIGAGPAAIAAPVVRAAPAPAATAAATTNTDDPLIIVLDVSGSMDDADGSGGVKLASAKNAVERAVRARGSGSIVGVWAFPNAAECSSGGFIVPPERIDERSDYRDTASVLAKVDAMITRDGGTPIGAAMHDAAKSMTDRGYTGATMLLVTDGLNNCDPDPCEEAKSVRASGFDLTVDAIGFRTDETANTALNCIADATNGTFTDASNGDALANTLEGLAVPHLAMKLDYGTTVRAGSSPRVSVTVTNPTSNDARDVRTSLVFRRTGLKAIMPGVVPPVIRIGTIPAGGTETRTWTLTTSVKQAGATGSFTATVWSPATGSIQQPGEFTLATEDLDPTQALFGSLRNGPLVILGDSFSAGEGAEDHIEKYMSGVPDAATGCHRSRKTYLASRLSSTQAIILACSGAVTEDYEQPQSKDGKRTAAPQAEQLRGLKTAPGAVVFTFGGNDIGFSSIIADCVTQAVVDGATHATVPVTRLLPSPGFPNCSGTSDAGQQKLKDVAALAGTLEPLYREIWLDANTPEFVEQRHGAYAPVIVSTYPQVFLPSRQGRCSVVWSHDGVEYGNQLTAGLMAAAKTAATRAAKKGYEVYFAAEPLDAFQTDHTYCASDANTDLRRLLTPDWTHGTGMAMVLNTASQESMHPNANGYQDTTDALLDWATTVERTAPRGEALGSARTADATSIANTPVQMGTTTITLNGAKTVTLTPGQSLQIEASGYAPGAVVTIVLHSAPTVLGSAVADASGVARLRTVVPSVIAYGKHELQADGADPKGALHLVTAPATVVQPMPLWLLAAGVGAVLLVLLAGFVGVRTAMRVRP